MQRLCALALLLLVSCASGPAAMADESAADFVRRLAAEVLPGVTDASISPEERRRRFRTALRRDFDLAKIGKLVLGRHWRRAGAGQRKEFAALLENYLAVLYARRFENLGGVKIAVDGVRDFDGWSMVYTTATRPEKTQVLLDWRVDRKDGGHAITDLVIEGVSMVIAQRDEFSAIVRQTGSVDGLLLRLRARIAG